MEHYCYLEGKVFVKSLWWLCCSYTGAVNTDCTGLVIPTGEMSSTQMPSTSDMTTTETPAASNSTAVIVGAGTHPYLFSSCY